MNPQIGSIGITDLLTVKEAPTRETVWDRYTNDWLAHVNRVLDDEAKVVSLIRSTSHDETTAMNPQGNGKLLVFITGGPDDVESKTVFTYIVANLITLVRVSECEAEGQAAFDTYSVSNTFWVILSGLNGFRP